MRIKSFIIILILVLFTSTIFALPTDVNRDGVVNIFDFVLVARDLAKIDKDFDNVPANLDPDDSDPNIPNPKDFDGDGYTRDEGDCNDNDPLIHPRAIEDCNDNVDNDCNGIINDDEFCREEPNPEDTDGDGFSVIDGDCNDEDPLIHPDAREDCSDNVDNDCNGKIDLEDTKTYYLDADKDGFGGQSITTQACSQPVGYTSERTDCNDNNAEIHPKAIEICNGLDDNCWNGIDEGEVCPVLEFYCDTDRDGFISKQVTDKCDSFECIPNECTSIPGDDCDDALDSLNPDAREICDNGIDNNCNGLVDYEEFCDSDPIIAEAVTFLRFEDSNNLGKDFGLNNLDATCEGESCPAVVEGKFGNAVNFNSNHLLSFGELEELDLVKGGEFAISVYYKHLLDDYPDQGGYIISKVNSKESYAVWTRGLYVYCASPTMYAISYIFDPTKIGANEWYHFACNFKKTGIDIYTEGVKNRNGESLPFENLLFDENLPADVLVGGLTNTEFTETQYKGSIDELFVIDRLLTEEEIEALRLGLGFS